MDDERWKLAREIAVSYPEPDVRADGDDVTEPDDSTPVIRDRLIQ